MLRTILGPVNRLEPDIAPVDWILHIEAASKTLCDRAFKRFIIKGSGNG